MPYIGKIHHRRSIRLPGYDYSQAGAYYVTICTATRQCLFGEVVNGEMHLNWVGTIAHYEWLSLPRRYPGVNLDALVVMPNHVHGVILLTGRNPHPLSELVRRFKSRTARRINERRHTTGTSIWQRDYYEHIVRDEGDLDRIRQYIVGNPARWQEDAENPANSPLPPVGAGLIPKPQRPHS